MSLTKEAIEHLQKEELIRLVNENLNDLSVIALPSDTGLHDLEKYLPQRRRYRAKVSTASLPDFIAMSTETEGENKYCFIDADAMTAETIFNLGTIAKAGHGDHKAMISLDKTAEFKALQSVDGNQISQKQLAEWLEDWRNNITGYDAAGETIDIKKVIARVRSINIKATADTGHEDQNFSARRTKMEEISASSQHGELPAGILFRCNPYADLSERRINARLSLITGDTPSFVLRIQRPEHLQQELAEEFRNKLVEGLGESVPTFLGTISL